MAPLFVGSRSEVRSDRIGLAASTSDPGSADAGDVYYNTSDNALKIYNGSDWASAGGGGTIDMVASGSLSNGATVIIKDDGTVGIVTQTPSIDPNNPSVGSPTVFESNTTGDNPISATFDSNSNKVVIVYTDEGNSNYGTAVVGTVSSTAGDNSISFGTPVVFESSSSDAISVTFDSSNNKVVIAYRDRGNSDRGKCRVGTVSGTSISFGSSTAFEDGDITHTAATFDSSNNKVIIAYRDYTDGQNGYGTAVVGTVSGTSISFGTEVRFSSVSIGSPSATFDSSNNKVVIAFKDDGNTNHGKAVVGTVSGTSISFGSSTTFESAPAVNMSTVFDSSNNKVVITYYDAGNSSYGTAVVGTVSGTSISFGTPVVFESASTDYNSATFDSNSNKVIIAYKDEGNSNYGTVIVGTVSGTSISFGSPLVYESATTEYNSVTFDSSNNKVVIAYSDEGNSNYGTAVVFDVNTTTLVTNLTANNFLGFSDAAYTNGQTAKIQIEGSVDDAQTGLTTAKVHYVQNDGTLGISTDDPVVPAGTAISATEIIIET